MQDKRERTWDSIEAMTMAQLSPTMARICGRRSYPSASGSRTSSKIRLKCRSPTRRRVSSASAASLAAAHTAYGNTRYISHLT